MRTGPAVPGTLQDVGMSLPGVGLVLSGKARRRPNMTGTS